MVIVVILGGVIVILILLIFLWCMSQKKKQFEREKSLTVSVDNMVMNGGRNQGNPNIPDDSENGAQINIQMHSGKTRQVSDEVSVQTESNMDAVASKSYDDYILQLQQNETNGASQTVNSTYIQHQVIQKWLEVEVKALKYFHNFIQNGYDTMDMIRAIESESDLVDIGIVDQRDRDRIMKEIRELNGININIGIGDNNDKYINEEMSVDEEMYGQENEQDNSQNITTPASSNAETNDLNTNQYAINWNTEKLLAWIMQIDDGKYRRYSAKLSDQFFQEEICGRDIDKMSEQDLKFFGITNFGDRKLLYKHIQDLVDSQTFKPQTEGQY